MECLACGDQTGGINGFDGSRILGIFQNRWTITKGSAVPVVQNFFSRDPVTGEKGDPLVKEGLIIAVTVSDDLDILTPHIFTYEIPAINASVGQFGGIIPATETTKINYTEGEDTYLYAWVTHANAYLERFEPVVMDMGKFLAGGAVE